MKHLDKCVRRSCDWIRSVECNRLPNCVASIPVKLRAAAQWHLQVHSVVSLRQVAATDNAMQPASSVCRWQWTIVNGDANPEEACAELKAFDNGSSSSFWDNGGLGWRSSSRTDLRRMMFQVRIRLTYVNVCLCTHWELTLFTEWTCLVKNRAAWGNP